MSQTPFELDDPDLRAALKRAQGGSSADSAFRQRMSELMEREAAAMDAAVAPGTGTAAAAVTSAQAAALDDRGPIRLPTGGAGNAMRWWIRGLAVAACLVLAIGGINHYLHERHEQQRRADYARANHDVLLAMVQAQAKSPSDAGGVAVADLTSAGAVRDELAKRLGRAVPTPDLSDEGWKLASAQTCDFRSARAARFDFTRNGKRITLISVPTSQFNDADEEDAYEATLDGQPIAGYVAHGGVHCLSGDASISLSEIGALTEKLHQRT
jgi:hypothetical protein